MAAEHDSSFVRGLGYDWDTQELTMRLGKRTYVYAGVPEETYQAMLRADSLGKAFNVYIRAGGYSYREVTKS